MIDLESYFVAQGMLPWQSILGKIWVYGFIRQSGIKKWFAISSFRFKNV